MLAKIGKHAKVCPVCDNTFIGISIKIFCSKRCSQIDYYHRHPRKKVVLSLWEKEEWKQESIPTIAPPIVIKTSCDCHQYSRCMVCRNAEKRLAHKQNRVPVYMQAALAAAGG